MLTSGNDQKYLWAETKGPLQCVCVLFKGAALPSLCVPGGVNTGENHLKLRIAAAAAEGEQLLPQLIWTTLKCHNLR